MPPKHKVFAYITYQTKLLVFEHTESHRSDGVRVITAEHL